MFFERLSDLALMEEARARLDYKDAALLIELGLTDKNTFGQWRFKNRVPKEHRAVLLRVVRDRLTDEERERDRLDRGLSDLLRRAESARHSLDEILEKVKGIEEVRGLVQRILGSPPAAEKRRRTG